MLYKPLIGSEESGPLDVRGRSRVSKSLRFAGDIAGFNILSPPFLGPLAPGRWGQWSPPECSYPSFAVHDSHYPCCSRMLQQKQK